MAGMIQRMTGIINDLTTRLTAAEATATDACTEARDARAEATRATAALAHVNTGAALTNPAHFQRSPYNVNAPYNLNTKSGLLLYENAQEPLKVLFNGKAANIQAFLTSLLIDVEKFHLENAVMVTSDSARTQLLHAMTHNPKVVSQNLWPYALKHANFLFNSLPRTGHTKSPEQLFSNSTVDPHIGEIHPFGCPVYVLASEIASGKKMPKWEPRARLGCYLGPSPHHAANVNLILNPATGYISPQFHGCALVTHRGEYRLMNHETGANDYCYPF